MSESDKILEAFLDFVNAVESGCVNFRRYVAGVKGVEEAVAADFNKLFWEKRKGTKGEYGQTSKRSTNNSDIFQALQKKLREHNGFWQHKGVKYWFHQQDQNVIDRRKS